MDYRNTVLVLAEVRDAVLRELAAQELQQAFFPLGSAQKEPRRCSVQQPLQHGRRDVPRPAPSLPSKQDLWIAARRARRGEDSSGESVLRVLLLPHKRWRAGSLGLQAFLVVHAPVQGSLVRPIHADVLAEKAERPNAVAPERPQSPSRLFIAKFGGLTLDLQRQIVAF